MSNKASDIPTSRTVRELMRPENPRQNMEPSDMEPDDARQFFHDLMHGMDNRIKNMPNERFEAGGRSQRAKEYYGNDIYQLLAGIQAAIREWNKYDESLDQYEVRMLKERYGGRFVEGVEIGERLDVYQGSDFEFVTAADDDNESKFEFTH